MTRMFLGFCIVCACVSQPVPSDAMNCNLLSASQFNFGAYDPLSPVPLDVQATYALQCSPDHPQEKLNLKITLLSAADSSNRLLGTGTAKSISFGLYLDPGRTVPIDTRPVFELSDRISTLREYPVTIYGRLPAKQNIAAGIYRTSLNFLIEY